MLTAAGRSWGNAIKFIKLDNIVDLSLVSRSQRLSNELGKTSVQRLLSTLETRSDRVSRTRLLSTHSETASSTLSSGDTTSLSLLAVLRTRSRSEVVLGEFEVVKVIDGGFISLSALPVENLHSERRSGSWNRSQRLASWNETGCQSICSSTRERNSISENEQ